MCLRRAAFVIILLLLSAACEQRPARPGDVGTALVESLEIQGNKTLQHPGDTSQLNVIAKYAGGNQQNVTKQGVRWSSSDSSIAIVTNDGVLTAKKYGTTNITANYGGAGPASVATRVVPTGLYLLSGQVQDSLGYGVSQARVQSTCAAGSFDTTTRDYDGHFSVPAVGATALRIAATDYNESTASATVVADTNIGNLTLSHADNAFFTPYRLTVTASPSCSLPPEAATRSFTVAISARAGNSFVVDLGSDFYFALVGFVGSRDGNAVQFTLSSDGKTTSGYQFIDFLDSTRSYGIDGNATGTFQPPGRISATLSGTIKVFRSDSPGAVISACTASDHRLDFVR